MVKPRPSPFHRERVRLGPDADILLVVQVGERVRQIGLRRRVGLARQKPRQLDQRSGRKTLSFAQRALDRGCREALRLRGRCAHER